MIHFREEQGRVFKSKGSVQLRGKEITYRAVSEEWVLEADDGHPEATMFTYSYFADGEDAEKRPVLFGFNGGPGASSSQIHLGLTGPTRAKLTKPDKQAPVPPYTLEPNPASPLDVCDVVMIDPVGTGFARLLDSEAGTKYFGVDEDAAAFALLIEAWLNRYKRWQSPRYLLGESYGTLRCGMVAGELMGGPTYHNHRDSGVSLNGVIMLGSSFLNGVRIFGPNEPVESSVLHLPTFAAVYWYHQNPGKPLDRVYLQEVEQFAWQEYLPALYLGNRIAVDKKDKVAAQLAIYTGLDKGWLLKNKLRINEQAFKSMCCREKGLEIGIYDGRFTMPASTGMGIADPVADDAAMGTYMPVYVALMNGAKREELNISDDLRYDSINFEVNGRWNYQTAGATPGMPGRTAIQGLVASMRRNPDFRVFFGSGYYDLCTMYGYTHYVVATSDLDPKRVVLREYESGHLVYMGDENSAALGEDLRAFIEGK